MVATRPTKSFFSGRKEGMPRLHRASGLWKCGLAASLRNDSSACPRPASVLRYLVGPDLVNRRTSLLAVRASRSSSLGRSGWAPTLSSGPATNDSVDPVLSPWTASTELTATPRLGGMSLRISFISSGSRCPVVRAATSPSSTLHMVAAVSPDHSHPSRKERVRAGERKVGCMRHHSKNIYIKFHQLGRRRFPRPGPLALTRPSVV